MIYTQESTWDIGTSTGSISAEILQFNDMGANIIDTLETSTGSVNVVYKDNQGNVGARFTGSTSTGSISYTDTNPTGFSRVGNTFTSLDYDGALYTYTLSLTTSTGSIRADAESM